VARASYDFWRASNQKVAESAIAALLSLGIEERNDLDSEFRRKPGGRRPIAFRVALLLEEALKAAYVAT
jgi:hypothetical protein